MPDAGRNAALLLLAVGTIVTLIGIFPTLAGLVAAPALAALLRPLQDRLRAHVNAPFAALILVVVAWIGVVGPYAWLMSVAIGQIPAAVAAIRHTAVAARVLPAPFAQTNADSLMAHVGSTSVGWLSTAMGPALGNVAHAVLTLSVALLGLYFLLVSDDVAWRAVRQRLPFSAKGSDELRSVFVDVTRATVLGTLSSAALQGVSIGIGLRLAGNSAPALWGIVAGFATLIPVVGNALVWVPAVAASLLHRDLHAAVVLLLFGKLVPSLLDRVLKVGIARRLGHSHPMIVLLGALAGVRLVGPVGVLIGPALLRCMLELIRLYEREYGWPWAATRVE